MQSRDEENQRKFAEGQLDTKNYRHFILYYIMFVYQHSDTGIHGKNEESIEVFENVSIDEENAGVIPHKKEG